MSGDHCKDTTMQVSVVQHQQAMAFPMERIVTRYCRDYEVPAAAAELQEREIKRYLTICALHPEERFPMVASIDGLWHTFLLFTREYQAFCGLLGVPFVHHEPLRDGTDRADLQATYSRFLRVYHAEFGAPPPAVWPDRIDGECGGGDCESNCVQCR
jgi:hypothetical protein